jgi:hypothetical protein
MSELAWLMEWYAAQCNGDWEHQYGVRIETLDNPRWTITIDLEETSLYGRDFAAVEHDIENDTIWWSCRIEGGRWRAACGPRELSTVIGIFRDWATTN